MITTENKIRINLKKLTQAHAQINSFFWGDPLRAWKEVQQNYPLLTGHFLNGNFDANQTSIQIVLIFSDKHYKNWSPTVDEVQSDMLQVARDYYQIINKSPVWQKWGKFDSSPTFERFINDTGDEVAGIAMTLSFKLRDQSGYCDVPVFGYDFENEGTSSSCLPVHIFNTNMLFDIEIPSGDSYELNDTPITVKDINGITYGGGSVPSVSGGEIIIPAPSCADSEAVLKDEGGNIISTTDIASGTSQDITAPNGVVTVKNSEGTTIDTKSVLSGGTAIGNISDSIITLNGNALLNVPAETFRDIELIDQDLNPITPTSIVGNVVTVNAGASGLPSGTYIPKNAIGGAFDLLWQGATANVTTGSGTVEKVSGSGGWNGSAYARVEHQGDFTLKFKMIQTSGAPLTRFGISFLKGNNSTANLDLNFYNVYNSYANINKKGDTIGGTLTTTGDSTQYEMRRIGQDIIMNINGTDVYTENDASDGSFNIDSTLFTLCKVIDIQVIIP